MGHIFWNERIKLIDSGEMVKVLAIGDSWFHYPANNLITPLHEALERPTTYVIGENGARADELCAGHWLASFRSMLADYPTIELVAISAGGNDFAGIGDLDARILRPDCTGAPSADACYRPGQPVGVFADVANAYRILIAAVAAARPDATILLHNYDYAIPDGKDRAGPQELAEAADGQLPRAAARRAAGRRPPRRRARADRPIHAVPRRPADARRHDGPAARRSRLVGGNAGRRCVGERAAPAVQRLHQACQSVLGGTGARGARPAVTPPGSGPDCTTGPRRWP